MLEGVSGPSELGSSSAIVPYLGGLEITASPVQSEITVPGLGSTVEAGGQALAVYDEPEISKPGEMSTPLSEDGTIIDGKWYETVPSQSNSGDSPAAGPGPATGSSAVEASVPIRHTTKESTTEGDDLSVEQALIIQHARDEEKRTKPSVIAEVAMMVGDLVMSGAKETEAIGTPAGNTVNDVTPTDSVPMPTEKPKHANQAETVTQPNTQPRVTEAPPVPTKATLEAPGMPTPTALEGISPLALPASESAKTTTLADLLGAANPLRTGDRENA
jgi:hypothetical protein